MNDESLRMLRELWKALGCAHNPDDFKPAVQERMWAQALEMVRESTTEDRRIVRENQTLEAEILRLRADSTPQVSEDS